MFFLMKWREKWREKCSEISSRAGGFPQTPFYHQGVALLSSINPNPFFIRVH